MRINLIAMSDSPSGRISWRTLVQYLCGARGAILDIAANPNSVWLGLVFVLSAGLAREYDREDLYREPWHVLLPLVASLVTSLMLFFLVDQLAVRRSAKVRGFLTEYWAFLGLYWMTAPLAWLYAIPVERLMRPASAVEANLAMLAIVSIWRVFLIIRVIVVIYNANSTAVLSVVMLFANSLIIFFLELLPRPIPIMNIMAGVRLSEGERTIASATFLLFGLAIFTYPFWVIGTVVAFWCREPEWRREVPTLATSKRIEWTVWSLACASILGWGFILPATQREQQLRTQVETSIIEGRIQDAIAIMSSHSLGDLPPLWSPMSHLANRDRFLLVTDLVEVLSDRPSNWVRQLFLDEFRRQLEVRRIWLSVFVEMNDIERLKVLEVLKRLPEKNDIIRSDDDPTGFEHTGFESILRMLAEKEPLNSRENRVPGNQDVSDQAREILNDFTASQPNAN